MKTLLILLMVANASDATLTARSRSFPGFYESNPVMRPFTKTRATIGIAFGAESAIEFVGIRSLKKRHQKLARVWLGLAVADEGYSISYTATHAKLVH